MTARAELAEQIHEHVGSLRRYALVLKRNRDAAEDLVQDTLVKAIAAAESWQPGSDMRVWLFRIMHNTNVSDLRKVQVRERAKHELPEPDVAPDASLQLEVRQVLKALEKLPASQRQPIILVALKEMSYAEAAEALNLPLGTFYSRLGRGRAALRRLVEHTTDASRLRLVV